MSSVDPIVADVLAGKRERYRAIVEAYELPVRVVVAAILPDPQAVEDLVHEVFLTAYLKLRQYRPGTDFKAWIKTLARYVALNERRRWLKQRAIERPAHAEIEQTAGEGLDLPDLLDEEKALAHLQECVQALGPTTRSIVERYYFEGVSSREIAHAAQRTESSVWVALHRAREALVACLQGKGVLARG